MIEPNELKYLLDVLTQGHISSRPGIVGKLLHLGLIADKENEPVGQYVLTEKGRVYIKTILRTPIPTAVPTTVIKWVVVPQGMTFEQALKNEESYSKG